MSPRGIRDRLGISLKPPGSFDQHMSLFDFSDLPGAVKENREEETATEADVDEYFKKIHFDIGILDKFKKIYVLVSGGFDSTLLADYISRHYPLRTVFVNCYNPFEINKTLMHFVHLPNFIQIKPDKRFKYGEILENAFRNLPAAFELRCNSRYYKKIFGCCYYIKNKSFKNHPLFKEPTSCVISGIKDGDGYRRHEWMNELRGSLGNVFIHVHKGGQTYIYPFRDHRGRELAPPIRAYLRKKFPSISHSGCRRCPVLVLFKITEEGKRYEDSVRYAKKLGVDISAFDKQIPEEVKKLYRDIKSKEQHQLFDFLDGADDGTYEEGSGDDDLELDAPPIVEEGCKTGKELKEPCNKCWVILQYPCGSVCKTCSVENPSSTFSMFQSKEGRIVRHLQDPLELME